MKLYAMKQTAVADSFNREERHDCGIHCFADDATGCKRGGDLGATVERKAENVCDHGVNGESKDGIVGFDRLGRDPDFTVIVLFVVK